MGAKRDCVLFGRRRIVAAAYWFVGFSTVDLFVGLAGRTYTQFEFLDEPKGKVFLFFACAFVEETIEALFVGILKNSLRSNNLNCKMVYIYQKC